MEDRRRGESLPPSLLYLIAGVMLSQIGLETMRLALPQIVKASFGKFSYMAQLHFCAAAAGVAGRLIGGVLPDRWGLKSTYLGAKVFKVLLVCGLAAMFSRGELTFLAITVYYLLNGFSVGISRTSLQSIPAAITDRKRSLLEKYWAIQRLGMNSIQAAGPFMAAAVVAGFGFLSAFLVLPAAFAAAIALIAFGVQVPPPPPRTPPLSDDGFLRRSLSGAKIVFADPVLRVGFFGLISLAALIPMLYFIIAPAYGLLAAPSPQAASVVQARITGVFSAGGLAGVVLMLISNADRDSRRSRGELTGDVFQKALDRSTLRWMRAAALSLGAFLALLLPGTGAPAASAAVYAGMFVFGLPHVVTVLKLRSLFQSRIPSPSAIPKVTAFLSSTMIVVSSVALYPVGWAFDNLPSLSALLWLNVFMAAAALLQLKLSGDLARRLD